MYMNDKGRGVVNWAVSWVDNNNNFHFIFKLKRELRYFEATRCWVAVAYVMNILYIYNNIFAFAKRTMHEKASI